MSRILPFLLIASAAVSHAQPPAAPPVRTTLRAQPVLSEDDVDAQASSATVPDAPQNAIPTAPVAPVLPPATPIEAAAASSPLELRPIGDDALRLQIFLDNSNFGPGVIDGRPGHFGDLAAQAWNEANGFPLEDWTEVNTAARKAVPNPLATAIVPDFAKAWVGDVPTNVKSQAKIKRMTYRSTAEFMSERYHCDVPYLVLLNGNKKINNLKARDTLIVPNVKPFTIESLTGALHKEDPALSARHVVVDTKRNQARFYEAAPAALTVEEPGEPVLVKPRKANRGLIASFPITPGQPKFIHYGSWAVRNTVEFPTWRYDLNLLNSGKRSRDSETLEIPSGPNSPVGVLWCGLTKSGIGMHGTPNPETIGRARSHGCIRMANWDAVRLPTLIRPGTSVEIR
jgi:lipoprotein-anchoring transpeptidase ErfK/SrfK